MDFILNGCFILATRFINYTPQRLVVCFFGFSAIIIAFVLRYSTELLMLYPKYCLNRYVSDKKNKLHKIINTCFYNQNIVDNLGKYIKQQINSKRNEKISVCKKKPQIMETEIKMKAFDISGNLRTYLMMAFYIGYGITHIPGSLLAERYGGKWILTMALTLTTFLTFLTSKVLATGGTTSLLLVRFLMGLSEGPLFPALNTLIAQWVPPQERGILGTIVLSAGQVGILLVNLITGILIPYYELSLLVYLLSTCAVLWIIGFIMFCYNNPESNPYINESEKIYLKEAITSHSMVTCNEVNSKSIIKRPWKEILTNGPVWALITSTIQYDWSLNSIAIEFQNIASELKGLDFWPNLIICLRIVLPFVFNWMICCLSGFISDLLINKNILNTTETRQMMTLIAAFGPKFCCDVTSCLLCQDNTNLSALWNCTLSAMGAYYASIQLTAFELSPNYSSTIMAIANSFSSLTNILAPFLEEFISDSAPLQSIRSLIWLICIMFTSGEVQEFNNFNTRTIK